MTFDPIVHSNYIYEIINQSDYPTIRKLCTSNKQLSSYCQNNQQIRNLIRQKRYHVREKTIGFLSRLRELRELNIPYIFIDEVSKTNDAEIVDQLIRLGMLDLGENGNILIKDASRK